MKAFVEFGRETSNTKSSSHAEFKTWLIMVLYWACFHFIGLFFYKVLSVNGEKTCKKKTLCKGNSYKTLFPCRIQNLVNNGTKYKHTKIT